MTDFERKDQISRLTRNAVLFYVLFVNISEKAEKHRIALQRIVAALFLLAEIIDGKTTVDRLVLPVFHAILRLLRPAESATRRLIVVAAHGLVVRRRRSSPRPDLKGKPVPKGNKSDGGSRAAPFKLFDPPEKPAKKPISKVEAGYLGVKPEPEFTTGPRIRVIDIEPHKPWWMQGSAASPLPPEPEPKKPKGNGTISAIRLCRRLIALAEALKDIPRQARRYARWLAKPIETRKPSRASSINSMPPWLPKKWTHEVHEILNDCGSLAAWLPYLDKPQPDTS
jgi:hypothetical protein